MIGPEFYSSMFQARINSALSIHKQIGDQHRLQKPIGLKAIKDDPDRERADGEGGGEGAIGSPRDDRQTKGDDQLNDDGKHDEADDDQSEDVDALLERMRAKLAGARGGEYSKAAVGKRMKRPAAAPVIKRPASVITPVIKKPASVITATPIQPKLKIRFQAIHYLGTRIYWGGDQRYRVLTAHKKATKDFKWKTPSEAPRVWTELIKFCKSASVSL